MFNTIIDKILNADFVSVFACLSSVAALIKIFGIG